MRQWSRGLWVLAAVAFIYLRYGFGLGRRSDAGKARGGWDQPLKDPPQEPLAVRQQREHVHNNNDVDILAAAETVHPADPVAQMVDVLIVRGYGKPRAAGLKPKVWHCIGAGLVVLELKIFLFFLTHVM